jgi:hypothetical protein
MAFAISDGDPRFAPVSEYYRIFPQEITKSGSAIAITQPVVTIRPSTFQALVYNMGHNSHNERDVILIVHGHSEENLRPDGLSVPLNELTNMPTTEQAIGELLNMFEDPSHYEQTAAGAEAAFRTYTLTVHGQEAKIHMKPKTLEQVFNVLAMVRFRELNRVEVRACSLGLNDKALTDLGRLLGAKSISAPNTHMFYCRVNAGTPVSVGRFNQWVRSNPTARVFHEVNNQDNLFALLIRGTSVHRDSDSETTSKNLGWFFERFVMKGASLSSNTRFVIAGMDHQSKDKPFVLPLETEYRDHLVEKRILPGPSGGPIIGKPV